MSPTRPLFRLLSLLLVSCYAVLSQQQGSPRARIDTTPREFEVSVRLVVDGTILETPLDDSLKADLKQCLVLDDSATSKRLEASFDVTGDLLVAKLQLQPGDALRPHLIQSQYFEYDPNQPSSTRDFPEQQKKLIRFPVTAKLKSLAVTFVNGSGGNELAAKYSNIFDAVKEYATRRLIVHKRFSGKNKGLAVAYVKGSIGIPEHIWKDRDQYVLDLKPNPTVSCMPVRLGGTDQKPLPFRLDATQQQFRIVPVDDEKKRFKPSDLPQVVIRYKDTELVGSAKQEKDYYAAALVPELRYEISLSHKYYECTPWDNVLSEGNWDITLETILTMDRYPIQLAPAGKFIEGRLPDSVVCFSRDKRVMALFRADMIGVPRRIALEPPVNVELRPSDGETWSLRTSGLQRDKNSKVSIERVMNAKAKFAFRIDAPNELRSSRPRVSLLAESLPTEWRDVQLAVNQTKRETISWPRNPLRKDTVRISVEKPIGLNVREDVRWQNATFDTTLQWDGVSEIQFELYKLPVFEILYADLTQDNIDRSILLKNINSRLSAIEQRKDVQDCFLWLSNGVERSYGYSERARDIVNDLSRLEALVQDFYNELRRVVDGFNSSCKVLQRIQPEYHLFLSQSSFNWIRADVQTLTKMMKQLGLTEDQVTFYVHTDRKTASALGRFRIVNLSSTSR